MIGTSLLLLALAADPLGAASAGVLPIIGCESGPVHQILWVGDCLYMATSCGVDMLDTDGNRAKVLPSDIPAITPQEGADPKQPLRHLALLGNVLAAAAGSNGVTLIDVTTPSRPTKIAAIHTPGTSAYGVFAAPHDAKKSLLFVSSHPGGKGGGEIQIFDITSLTPGDAVPMVSSIASPDASPGNDTSSIGSIVGASSGTLYFYQGSGASQSLSVVDISDPAKPQYVISSADFPEPADAGMNYLVLPPSNTLVAWGGSTLCFLNGVGPSFALLRSCAELPADTFRANLFGSLLILTSADEASLPGNATTAAIDISDIAAIDIGVDLRSSSIEGIPSTADMQPGTTKVAYLQRGATGYTPVRISEISTGIVSDPIPLYTTPTTGCIASGSVGLSQMTYVVGPSTLQAYRSDSPSSPFVPLPPMLLEQAQGAAPTSCFVTKARLLVVSTPQGVQVYTIGSQGEVKPRVFFSVAGPGGAAFDEEESLLYVAVNQSLNVYRTPGGRFDLASQTDIPASCDTSLQAARHGVVYTKGCALTLSPDKSSVLISNFPRGAEGPVCIAGSNPRIAYQLLQASEPGSVEILEVLGEREGRLRVQTAGKLTIIPSWGAPPGSPAVACRVEGMLLYVAVDGVAGSTSRLASSLATNGGQGQAGVEVYDVAADPASPRAVSSFAAGSGVVAVAAGPGWVAVLTPAGVFLGAAEGIATPVPETPAPHTGGGTPVDGDTPVDAGEAPVDVVGESSAPETAAPGTDVPATAAPVTETPPRQRVEDGGDSSGGSATVIIAVVVSVVVAILLILFLRFSSVCKRSDLGNGPPDDDADFAEMDIQAGEMHRV